MIREDENICFRKIVVFLFYKILNAILHFCFIMMHRVLHPDWLLTVQHLLYRMHSDWLHLLVHTALTAIKSLFSFKNTSPNFQRIEL